jgi:hypothetical protein
MTQIIDHVLRQLAASFTVRDIMVERNNLVCSNSHDNAQLLLSQHPEYDIIPLPVTGPLTAYVRRDEQKVRKISSIDLISDGTSLMDLPCLLDDRVFFFVLSSNQINGYIHYSDLNNSLMKLPFFVLFEAVECFLWQLVSGRLDEADIPVVLDQDRVNTINKRKSKAQKNDVDMGWSGLFTFSEILKFAFHYGFIDTNNEDRDILTTVRNRVAHADKLLIKEHKDAKELAKTYNLCQQILNTPISERDNDK